MQKHREPVLPSPATSGATIRDRAAGFHGGEQELLLPPSLRDWLPEDHFAWFVIEAVGELDLAVFCAAYRADGHGRAAHDPAMTVAGRRSAPDAAPCVASVRPMTSPADCD